MLDERFFRQESNLQASGIDESYLKQEDNKDMDVKSLREQTSLKIKSMFSKEDDKFDKVMD